MSTGQCVKLVSISIEHLLAHTHNPLVNASSWSEYKHVRTHIHTHTRAHTHTHRQHDTFPTPKKHTHTHAPSRKAYLQIVGILELFLSLFPQVLHGLLLLLQSLQLVAHILGVGVLLKNALAQGFGLSKPATPTQLIYRKTCNTNTTDL